MEGKTFGLVAEVPRLQRGALNLVDIATSTMANIAPAMSFFFSFARCGASSSPDKRRRLTCSPGLPWPWSLSRLSTR
jgi:hypothetical protein